MKNLKMFDIAYMRLTLWYMAIIMVISLAFSVWVYNQARHELQFGLNRIVVNQFAHDDFGAVINERLNDSRHRLIGRLILFNTFVLVAGAGASYWLARRTMQPIEDAVDAQERFTADASHELRTPLAAMKAEIEVGLRDKKITKDEAVALLKSNLEEVDRLGNLAEGLLTLTQNDAQLDTKPVALDDVAGTVSKRFRPLAETKKIELAKDLAPVRVVGDEQALSKIISILLDNAIKYSPEAKKITVRTFQKDGFGVVEVADEGIGIKASELPHIFDRFYRADSSRSKTHVAGHGLGLAIAQKLVDGQEGKITATSTPGKGSTFSLRIPLSVG